MSVAVIVPWRDKGDPRRRANNRRTVSHLLKWRSVIPGLTELLVVSDGRPDDAPFGRQHAYNRGLAESLKHHDGGHDVYVFHEADMVIPYHQLDAAVELAAAAPGLVIPFDTYAYLDAEDSIDVVAGADPATYKPRFTMPDGRSIGAVNVVSRATMETIGCWDEQLTGHGYDDNCMEAAFRVATGQPTRHITGPGWHLWHPMAYAPWEKGTPSSDPSKFSRADVEATRLNKSRLELYRQATTSAQIRALTRGEA